MDIKNILSAKESIHKMVPFIKGISNPPDKTEYVDELNKKLKTILGWATNRLIRQQKN